MAAGTYKTHEHFESLTLERYTVASNGTTALDTSVDLYAYFRRLSGTLTQNNKDIRPSHQVDENFVPMSRGERWEITVIQRSDDEQALFGLIDNGRGSGFRFHVTWESAEDQAGTWGTFASMDYSEGEQDSEQTMTVRFDPYKPTDAAQSARS